MTKEEIKTYFEELAQDCDLDLSNKRISSFANCALELISEEADVDEIREELISIAPDDNDEWQDFVDEASKFIMDQINDGYSENETEDETEEE